MKENILRRDLRRNGTLYLILLPVLAFYIIFHYFPMFGVVMAFERFNPTRGFIGSDWVGFKWFEQFFGSYYFSRLLKNTLFFSVLTAFWYVSVSPTASCMALSKELICNGFATQLL